MKRFIFILAIALLLFSLPPGQAPATAQETRPERPYPLSPEVRAQILAGSRLPVQEGSTPPAYTEMNALPQAETDIPNVYNWVNYVYCLYDFNAGWEIVVSNSLTPDTAIRRLTWNNASDIYPRLRRGADKIVFMTNRDGNMEIYTMDTYGGNVTRLTYDPAFDDYPAWSPDGTQIAFARRVGSSIEIFVMNQDGSAVRQLTNSGGVLISPTWSPDGAQIAFIQIVSSTQGRILIMKADGSGAVALAPHLTYVDNLAWSPDGEYLAFEHEANGDGWLDLGKIAIDGTYPIYVAERSGTDFWMGGWTPVGDIVATELNYTFDGYLSSARVIQLGETTGATGQGTNWTFMPDVQSTDITVPTSMVNPLQPFTRGNQVYITWTASDPGPAMIQSVRTQYRTSSLAVWNYIPGSTQSGATYYGSIGDKVYFRTQAVDWAENYEPWPPGDGDTYTQLYAMLLKGRFIDVRGHGLYGVNPSIYPPPFSGELADASGAFTRYLHSLENYLSVNKTGYSNMPSTPVLGPLDRQDWWVLAPDDNLVQNGSFEAQKQGWQNLSDVAVFFSNEERKSGTWSALLGKPSLLTSVELLTLGQPLDWMFAPVMALDASGTLHLVWRSDTHALSYRQKPDGGSWSTVETWPTSEYPTLVALQAEPTGSVHLVWLDCPEYESCPLRYSVRPAGGAWSTPQTLPSTGGISSSDESSRPKLLLDSENNLHLVYTDTNGLWYTSLPAGGASWTAPLKLSSYGFRSSLAIDASDQLFVTYLDQTSLKLAVRSPGGVWSPAQSLPAALQGFNSAKIAVDGSGQLHIGAVKVSPDGVTSWISLARRSPEGVWSPLQELPSQCYVNYDHPFTLSASLEGAAHLACSDAFGEGMFYSQFLPSGAWSRPIPLTASEVPGILALPGTDSIIYWDHYTAVAISPVSLPTLGESGLSQSVTIPAQAHKPTLSLMHRIVDTGSGGQFTVMINNTPVITPTLSGQWTHSWVDVSEWAGQTITLSVRTSFSNLFSTTIFGVDDISISAWRTPLVSSIEGPMHIRSGYQNLRLTIHGENFMPGVKVYLGGKLLLNPAWVDETTVEATLPANMPIGLHELVVVNPGGYDGALPAKIRLGHIIMLPVVRK